MPAGGLALPVGSHTSQVASPAGSRFFSRRRSGHKRLSSGTWPWQPGAGGSPGASASSSHLGQPERAAGSEARPSASHFVPLARRSPVRWQGVGGPGGEAQQALRASLEGPSGQRASIDGGFQPAQQAQQVQQQAVMQVVLSLKVMVAAGTVCAFHIGGGQESADDASSIPVGGWVVCRSPGWLPVCGVWLMVKEKALPGMLAPTALLILWHLPPGLQRWEFFIGDTPQPEEHQAGQEGEWGSNRPRPPIAQLEAAEHYAVSGKCAQVAVLSDRLRPAGCLVQACPGRCS